MDDKMIPPAVVGNVAKVESCPCGNAVVLTVGALSLRLDLAAAADVAETLVEMLTLLDEADVARCPERGPGN
jgi:hypothetical protein